MVYTDGNALVADTIEELHTFAPKAGVFTFYDHRRRPHYLVDKTSLPTVMAHGAKRVSPKKLHELSNAMARKRELWYVEATDEQLREKIQKYAPFQQGESIFYEGQNFTQAEMFEIMFNMYKDMQADPKKADAVAKRYKLPSVLPLQPRKDPPTDREVLADLYNKIEYGKTLLLDEEAKAEKNLDYITDIKVRMDELYKEYDPLQIKVQQDAIDELKVAIEAAHAEVEALGKIDVSIQEHREKVSKHSTLKTQLEALQQRMGEILIEQDTRKQEEATELTQEMVTELRNKYHALLELMPAMQQLSDDKTQAENTKKLEELRILYENTLDRWTRMQPEQPVENLVAEEVDYTKDNPNLTDASDKSKYPDLGIGYDHDNPQRNTVYQELSENPNYKVVYDPAHPKEGESYTDVEVDKLRESGLIPPPTPPEMLGGFNPFPIDKIEDRIKQLEEAKATGIPIPGYGWFGDELVTLGTLELLDKAVRKLFSEFTYEDFLETYKDTLPFEDKNTLTHAPQDVKDKIRDLLIDRHTPPTIPEDLLNEPLLPEDMHAQTPALSQDELDKMTEEIRQEVTKAAIELGLDRFLEMYPQYTAEDYFAFNRSVTGASPG